MQFDYFYPEQADQYAFYRIPDDYSRITILKAYSRRENIVRSDVGSCVAIFEEYVD